MGVEYMGSSPATALSCYKENIHLLQKMEQKTPPPIVVAPIGSIFGATKGICLLGFI